VSSNLLVRGVTAFGPGDREREKLGRSEESAFFWRMMKVVGHETIELMELDGGTATAAWWVPRSGSLSSSPSA
jgi:hypothetical protein